MILMDDPHVIYDECPHCGSEEIEYKTLSKSDAVWGCLDCGKTWITSIPEECKPYLRQEV